MKTRNQAAPASKGAKIHRRVWVTIRAKDYKHLLRAAEVANCPLEVVLDVTMEGASSLSEPGEGYFREVLEHYVQSKRYPENVLAPIRQCLPDLESILRGSAGRENN